MSLIDTMLGANVVIRSGSRVYRFTALRILGTFRYKDSGKHRHGYLANIGNEHTTLRHVRLIWSGTYFVSYEAQWKTIKTYTGSEDFQKEVAARARICSSKSHRKT